MDGNLALQNYTFTSKYANHNKDKNRRESYDEATDRVISMHRKKYAEQLANSKELQEAFDKVETALRQKLILGSQRALQFAGAPIIKTNPRLYNCIASYCDRPRFFAECLWLLLCGCGAGFSVQKHHVAKLPCINKPDEHSRKLFVIPDTIEGWADSLDQLINSYFIPGSQKVVFDYSLIRPKGAPLSSGGKAPGPKPLRKSLELIRSLLDARVAQAGEGSKLRPIDCYDIVMHASDAVLSGGIRRSATIALFSVDDYEMATAKTGDWFVKNPQRARSNNSAVLLRDSTSYSEFLSLIESTKQFGEPGFVWADDLEILFNPCLEISLYGYDDKGNSGWQACNLTSINISKCESKDDFLRGCEAASILGTLQAGYTEFRYLGEVSESIIKRESLLGVSMTGIMEKPSIALDKQTQQQGAILVKEVNKIIAPLIGINPAARTTCVKPEGSASAMLGTSSGIHPHHSKKYFRRVQTNGAEMPAIFYKEKNPKHVEKSKWSREGTDLIVTFCVETPEGLTKEEIGSAQLLEIVKDTQTNWVIPGTDLNLCVKPWLKHNVSNTISVKDDEWDDVSRYIYDNREYFTGVSLIKETGELEYTQAPFVSVWDPEQIIAEYGTGAMFASGLIVSAEEAFGDLWEACDVLLDRKPLPRPEAPDLDEDEALMKFTDDSQLYATRKNWIRRAEKFANNYFKGDVTRMTHCAKRVHCCKHWQDLVMSYQEVNFLEMFEEQDNTTKQETVACAGGACEI